VLRQVVAAAAAAARAPTAGPSPASLSSNATLAAYVGTVILRFNGSEVRASLWMRPLLQRSWSCTRALPSPPFSVKMQRNGKCSGLNRARNLFSHSSLLPTYPKPQITLECTRAGTRRLPAPRSAAVPVAMLAPDEQWLVMQGQSLRTVATPGRRACRCGCGGGPVHAGSIF
jgi:hypothetical protein